MRPRRDALTAAGVLLVTLLIAAPAAHADFGVSSFTAEVRASDHTTLVTQAGAHPYEGVTSFTFNSNALLGVDGNVKDVRVDVPPGLISNPQATPRCLDSQYPSCPKETQ